MLTLKVQSQPQHFFFPSLCGMDRIHCAISPEYACPAKIVEIIERIEMPHSATEPTRGEIIKAKFDLENPICIETDNRFGRLNRFALRESNEVIGCGRCLSVVV